ncbi:MAG: hypothetical protein Fur0037_04400 [Planctomycetota bacterium]
MARTIAASIPMLLLLAACHGSDSGSGGAVPPPRPSGGDVHRWPYDPARQTYQVRGLDVSAAAIRRDLNGALCSQCHAAPVDQIKASVHYATAARTERVMFPGGGAHGMLDRACGLPATTGLTNHFSDINLGECAKCHVGRYQPIMEGILASDLQQAGIPSAAEQARRIVNAGIDCLICHAESYRSVPADGRLAGVAASGASDHSSPNGVGSARAARDDGDFDQDGVPDPMLDTDGDGVADAPLLADSDGDGVPDRPLPTVAQDRGPEAVISVGKTTERACLRCHEHARTGYKRGTLFDAEHDVHAAAATGAFAGARNRCTVCHAVQRHRFVRGHAVGGDIAASDYPPPPPGTAPSPTDATDITCSHCHDVANDPVLNQVHVPEHLARIACETCHIRRGSGMTYSLFGHGGQVSFARNSRGEDTRLVVADAYVFGDAADRAADADAYPADPILMWFDGGTSFLAQSLAARGMPNAKVTPFKPMANGMVFDARFFRGEVAYNDANQPYNAYSMYRFYANGSNAEAFAGLGLLETDPGAVRRISLLDLMNADRKLQAMALLMIFPNLVYFDKAAFGYEHYLTRNGSLFDADRDGIIDRGSAFSFDMLAAANSGLGRFRAFNRPMGFPANYEWYPAYQEPADVISMKLPDGSLIKMFLQMQANAMPEPQRREFLSAVAFYPSFSQITLGGHGVVPKERALGANGCRECHGRDGVLARPVPVGRKVPTNLGSLGTVELPVYAWKYYNLRALVDLGLSVTCEQIAAGTADVDVSGDARYLRASGAEFVVNWFEPSAPNGYLRADSAAALAGSGLAPADLTWSGGPWMPVLEPVTDPVPNWQVLGLPSRVIWR